MKMPYRTEDQVSARAREMGQKIVHLLVKEGLTYQEADDALASARDELLLTVPAFPLSDG